MPGLARGRPRNLHDLYLGRGEDVGLSRPVMSGDVFTGVDVSAANHPGGIVMVVAHPCSMRGARGRLRPRLTVAPIRPYDDVPFERWPTGHNNVFPLPSLGGDGDQARSASLLELATADSAHLLRERRIAALTTRGVLLLQQRLVFSLTRVLVGLEKFEEQSAHVLLEAELEDEWVDALMGEDADGEEAITAQSGAFAAFMDAGSRELLLDPERRSDVARAVRAEIRARSRSSRP